MTQQAVFSPKMVAWLITIGVLAFAGAAYFMIYGDKGPSMRAGTNAFSYSALGHRAFVETLRRHEVPVFVSRNHSAAKAGRSSLLVIAEPRIRILTDKAINELLAARTILLVLPKWKGRPDTINPRWFESVALIPSASIEMILKHVIAAGKITRVMGSVSWETGPLGVAPTLSAPQLMETTQLRPIVASDQGLLIGELVRNGQRIWVLSDPDILSNHGIGRGDNALLTLRLIEALRLPGRAVIIDETIHGFRQESNLWGAVFEFPFVVPTILTLAAVTALMWAATGRFGAPIAAKRPMEEGKMQLIDNTAGLLQYSGNDAEILRRYLSVTLREVGRRLNAPRNLDEAALSDWVDRVGDARGVKAQYGTIRREAEAIGGTIRADSPRLAQAAQNLYRWKQEMINGPGGHRLGRPRT